MAWSTTPSGYMLPKGSGQFAPDSADLTQVYKRPPGRPMYPPGFRPPRANRPQSEFPLSCNWTFYFYRRTGATVSSATFLDQLVKFGKASCVEHFWSIYTHFKPISTWQRYADVYIFRDDIVPEWERVENRGGGSMLIACERDVVDVDVVFERLLLELIGNKNPVLKHVVGIVGSHRAEKPRVSLWMSTVDKTVKEQVKAWCRSCSPPGVELVPEFKAHHSHTKTKSTGRKAAAAAAAAAAAVAAAVGGPTQPGDPLAIGEWADVNDELGVRLFRRLVFFIRV